VDVLQATLARRTVRFRLYEEEAPIPGPDPIVRTGMADLQERRALLHWSAEGKPRGVLQRGWRWLWRRFADPVWQDEREYWLVDEGRAWTTFHGIGGPLAAWPLWPLDLLVALPDTAGRGSARPGHQSARIDLAVAARLVPQLLMPGPIRLGTIADVPVELWLDGAGLVRRVSVTLDGERTWTVLELRDHGAAQSVPRVDPARIVLPSEVRTWRSHPRRVLRRSPRWRRRHIAPNERRG
jgi:hypothetical protein